MQGENTTMLREKLNLDLITQNGNKKYNITSTNRLQRIMRSRPIVILIHGYMETSDGVMVQALGTEFLKISDLNVFALDGRNVIGLEYLRSSTYVRFMGEELGRLLSGVIKRGQNASMITLIGHSLGAHVAGVAGEKVKQDTGHKDFFPNNGMSQPDCYLSTCDHSRAWELYAESINNPRRFPARKCDSWSEFQSGSCMKNEVSYMGINSRKGSSGLYFLTTGSASPFGLGAAGSG
ncbi:unnamed protein product [Leptidea sinapis]|uniref:Lipase domain-containing protein n=1 Tax=Leptidea sinapis TaxID=189913 RepID=A0A5E4Q8M0_9NEOP|nr:unnamed protein product [Leptidea sinapis]